MFILELDKIHRDDIKRIKENINHYIQYYKNKYEVAAKIKPKVILEIGVRAGYSAMVFLMACPKARYIGYDNNAGKHSGAKGLKYSDWAKDILSGYDVKMWPSFDTQKVLSLPDKGDFVHVDGDHSFGGCLHDLYLAVDSGAKWILVDDYSYIKDVKKAVDRFLADNNFKHKFIFDMRGQMLIWTR
jgi:hypothetical protein